MLKETTKQVDQVNFGFHVAEPKRDPRDRSYWTNPIVELINVQASEEKIRESWLVYRAVLLQVAWKGS